MLAGHPLDLIKVQLQTMPKPAPGEPPMYTGVVDCVRKTIATQGLRGIYRGVMPPLIGITPIFAICFWGYETGQQIVRSFSNDPEPDMNEAASAAGGGQRELTLTEYAVAGGLSAVPTTAIMGPGERLKCLLQYDGQRVTKGLPPKYAGAGDCVRKLYAEGGLRAIFRGTPATLLRDGPGSVAYFGAYEGLKRLLTPAGKAPGELSVPAVLFAGGSAGICNWLVSIPPDVLKSRLQTAEAGKYSGVVLGRRSVLKELLAEEGLGALYKGIAPALLRAFPANAACFMGVESSKAFLTKLGL